MPHPHHPPPLNPAQAEAVEHLHGPLLVLAGAGSGKTRVITQRIGRLVERGIPSKAILAMTFTNKAAGEMAERAHAVMHERGNGGAARALTVSTFHSFGLSVLTREQKAHGGAFTIFDQGDVLSCVKEILSRERIGKNLDAAAICGRISNAKNAFLQPEDLPDDGKDEYDEITKIVYPRYQAAMRAVPRVRLRRSGVRGGAAVEAAAGRARALAGRLPLPARRRVPGQPTGRRWRCSACSRRRTRTCASSATTTRPSTRGAAPT